HLEDRCFVSALGFAAGMDAALEKARNIARQTADGFKLLLVEARDTADERPQASTQLKNLVDAGAYAGQVQQILKAVAEGEVYQACLTHRMEFQTEKDPWALYLRMRERNPAPFASYLSLPEVTVLSSSPERFLRVHAGGEVESRPIKGTRPRGKTELEDQRLREELNTSDKDRAENLMIADLVRNDLGRVCELGSVHVSNLQQVEDHATVFQMVTTVCGALREECDALEALRACFPPGSMTGAPKIAAMRLLETLESVERGVYSGGLGYLDCRGGMDLAVVIRTLLLREGRADLHVGGGVVADSIPAEEYQESLHKAKAWLEVLGVVLPSS
ncbi:MAG: aminodeoxychorismate synthase component I, partial [Deltaproteobacteria bacterium]|nr:aminodeoxychorismate synthase component I [Deltaproteobacteria bacterium]